jgi:hypothetical protein
MKFPLFSLTVIAILGYTAVTVLVKVAAVLHGAANVIARVQ